MVGTFYAKRIGTPPKKDFYRAKSLMNLTVTIEKTKNQVKRTVYSNFDPLNTLLI